MRTRRHTRPLYTASVLAATITLAGCGGGTNTPSNSTQANSNTPTGQTATQASNATPNPNSNSTRRHPTLRKAKRIKRGTLPVVEKVQITSPAVTNETIDAKYTCGGSDTSPPLQISGIPAGTAELIYMVLNLAPVNGQLYFNWAVAGISPHQHTIAAGQVPPGAVQGTNSKGQAGYSLCPQTSENTKYIGVLFALPRHLHAKAGFDPSTLRIQALKTAKYEGFLAFSYQHQ